MKTVCSIAGLFLLILSMACKKGNNGSNDVRDRFTGNWAGAQSFFRILSE